MSTAYLSFILHCHLPFVRHPEYDYFLEENWLFEALSETYLPLLRVFESLEADQVPFKLTISISPTLSAMLADKLLQDRYIRHLDMLIELGEKEIQRCKGDPDFEDLAVMYHDLFSQNKKDFCEKYNRNILQALLKFKKSGHLELIPCAATHAFLPAYENFPNAVKAQIQTGIESFIHHLGILPKGFWLPEMAYYPGLEEQLKLFGIEYFFIDAHGALNAAEVPQNGVFSPLCCPNGVHAFPREIKGSQAVWSAETGYPGDFSYRDFYRDIGFDLPLEYIKPYILEGELRINTGYKYYAITGLTDQKKPYRKEEALKKIMEHSANFLYNRQTTAAKISPLIDRTPLFVYPFDAELFGHWWFEGPLWIEQLFRSIQNLSNCQSILPGEYLKEYPENQICPPSFSSWGNKGYSEVWIDDSNDWIYQHNFKLIEDMQGLIDFFPDAGGLNQLALNQALRELLLAQASDWPFIMKMGTTLPYATKRVKEHIRNFYQLRDALYKNKIDIKEVAALQQKNNIFPFIDYKSFKK